jgi:WD40 repeat protein
LPIPLQALAIKDFPGFSVEWSPCGKYIAFKSELYPTTLFIYDMSKLHLSAVLLHECPVRVFKWNPKVTDQLVIALRTSGNIYLWNPNGCSSVSVPSGIPFSFIITLFVYLKLICYIDLFGIVGFEVTSVGWNPDGNSILVTDKEKFCIAFPIN